MLKYRSTTSKKGSKPKGKKKKNNIKTCKCYITDLVGVPLVDVGCKITWYRCGDELKKH